jgi:GMP synthase-like glutamine amidotransferase
MILLIDTCCRKGSLGSDEFVKPVVSIVKNEELDFVIKHFLELKEDDLERVDKVILCGVTLKDNEFMKHPEKFDWIKHFDKPILGICSGMLITAKILEGVIEGNTEIGMSEIRTVKTDILLSGKEKFEAYELHNFSVRPSREFAVLAVSDRCVQAIKHKSRPVYGVQFHPEVRNEWIIERFLNL